MPTPDAAAGERPFCRLCGCTMVPGEMPCPDAATALERTERNPFGCPWLDDKQRAELKQAVTPDAAAGGGLAGEASEAVEFRAFDPPIRTREGQDLIDEIVAERVSIHLEDLDGQHAYLGIEAVDGHLWQVYIRATKGGRLQVTCGKREGHPPTPAVTARIAAATPRALSAPAAGGEAVPVAWRVKDFADGWIMFGDEAAARREADFTGALMQPLYAAAPSTPAAAGDSEPRHWLTGEPIDAAERRRTTPGLILCLEDVRMQLDGARSSLAGGRHATAHAELNGLALMLDRADRAARDLLAWPAAAGGDASLPPLSEARTLLPDHLLARAHAIASAAQDDGRMDYAVVHGAVVQGMAAALAWLRAGGDAAGVEALARHMYAARPRMIWSPAKRAMRWDEVSSDVHQEFLIDAETAVRALLMPPADVAGLIDELEEAAQREGYEDCGDEDGAAFARENERRIAARSALDAAVAALSRGGFGPRGAAVPEAAAGGAGARDVPEALRRLSEAATPDWRLDETSRGVAYIVGPSSNDAIPSPDVILSSAYSDRSIPQDNANLKLAHAAVNFVRALLADRAQGGR